VPSSVHIQVGEPTFATDSSCSACTWGCVARSDWTGCCISTYCYLLGYLIIRPWDILLNFNQRLAHSSNTAALAIIQYRTSPHCWLLRSLYGYSSPEDPLHSCQLKSRRSGSVAVAGDELYLSMFGAPLNGFHKLQTVEHMALCYLYRHATTFRRALSGVLRTERHESSVLELRFKLVSLPPTCYR
jgi:hypothetical protein